MSRWDVKKWVSIGIINLWIVSLIGAIMRYKIAFSFPFLSQKNLLHSHSHFAFSGWVTLTLFALIVFQSSKYFLTGKKYNYLMAGYLLCSFGMLVSFAMQGYGMVSIIFSTLSIFIIFPFSFVYFKDSGVIKEPSPAIKWFRTALIFNVLSSLGTFYLAYMMMTKTVDQKHYLGSVYFYLHFQYSGWFFFTIMGLIMGKISEWKIMVNDKFIYYSFLTACIPAYFLSILWANLPLYIFALSVIAVLLQLVGLYFFIRLLKSSWPILKNNLSEHSLYILGLSIVALVIKLGLQTGSVIPEVSHLAFGFRSIVIAYLHLVLLAFTTLFLLGYIFAEKLMNHSKWIIRGLWIFTFGVFANELVLMVQGVASFGYIVVPYLNQILFFISLIMFTGLTFLVFYNRKTEKN